MNSGASIGLRYVHGQKRLSIRRPRKGNSLSEFTAMRPCYAARAPSFRNETARLIICARRCWRVPFRVHLDSRLWGRILIVRYARHLPCLEYRVMSATLLPGVALGKRPLF